MSRSEHKHVGELVETIDCNDSQALSDENIDGLRSACHDAAVPLDGAVTNALRTFLSNMGERLGLAQSYISTPHHIGSSADPNDPTGPICDGWPQRLSSCHVRAMTYTTLAFLNDERHTLAFLPGAHSTRSCVRPACLCSAPVTPAATPGVGRPKSGHVNLLSSSCTPATYT